MKRLNLKHIGNVVWLMLLCPSAGALTTPANSSAGVKSSTVPPSYYQESSFRPDTERTKSFSGNLMVTGNVAEGKHFRSTVPYQNTSALQTPLGSTSLDNFYRYAADSVQRTKYDSQYVPFYSQGRTTAQTLPGQARPLGAPLPSSGTYQPKSWKAQPTPGSLRLTGGAVHEQNSLRVPVSSTLQEVQARLARDFPEAALRPSYSSLPETDVSRTLVAAQPTSSDLPNTYRAEEQTRRATVENSDSLSYTNLESHEKTVIWEPVPSAGYESDTGEGETLSSSESDYAQTGDPLELAEGQGASGQEPYGTPPSLEEHEHLAAFNGSRSQDWTAIGDAYLRTDRPQEALDAYKLAVMYQANNASALAGQSLAHLALREYVSSALFLRRTLEVFPAYAGFSVDWSTTWGPTQQLEQSLREIEKLCQTSSNLKLQFLLAYLYFQTGDLGNARLWVVRVQADQPNFAGLTVLLDKIEQGLGTLVGSTFK